MTATARIDRPRPVDAPYEYRVRELVEPDWRRIPAWRSVTEREWADVRWQRATCVKSVDDLRAVYGSLLAESFYDDVARDQEERATMSILLPPQVLNTMVPDAAPSTEGMYADPVRRYMLPAFSDRHPTWPSHPLASRDSLHESDMWMTEGLTHRYPTKVLAELLSTCPQYCGHCTRMDLVGNSTPLVDKQRFRTKQRPREEAMLDYLERTPGVRDVVVSGGDVANVPVPRLEAFVSRLMEIDSIRDIRLASKSLADLPQHWLAPETLAAVGRLVELGRRHNVQLAVHTHVNAAESVTPLVALAAHRLLELGVRDIRNQGVLLRGVNTTRDQLLDLCFALIDEAWITPYYFYMCDMIPNAEHWRISLADAQELQHGLMGYLPGFSTPRIVCDVPWAGKRWVHQVDSYDRLRGISSWRKAFATPFEEDPDVAEAEYEYYDPLDSLPAAGQEWWTRRVPARRRAETNGGEE